MLNKYKELHSRHVELLVHYYNLQAEWQKRVTEERTIELRGVLRQLIAVQQELKREIASVRKISHAEFKRKKEARNEHNNTSN